ncbi:hypothetical protein KDJ21_020650 [Metabacillus litoralis]|uniref:hypothetical protein n=1 Tax=Metabacillus TaxID=2675233 RepID=UPI001B9CFEF0|nr:hypothetical protein [Metabacillus litoralis]MCM3161346.1 hypothetical protein [Metabacillus litoralis]MCM3409197.1 hypothetical protein [Metabacillus litoralis]UHA59188.1 hypothetical protein KDJ21_020650 [Metabacillus litoralis]
MKKRLFLLFCIGVSLVGCVQEKTVKAPKEIQAETPQPEHIEEKSFIVEERQSEGYIDLKEVVKPDEIRTVVKILENVEWQEDIKVQMALPPEYRFSLGSINYAIWVTPTEDRLEIIAEGQSKYIKLPIRDSEILYKIITGKEF